MRRARPRILPILAALSAASLSACTHAPAGSDTPINESTSMPTEERKATPQPKLDAETALAKVLELIRSSKSIDDFTAEKVAATTGLQMHPDGSDRFGASETLTAEWWYSIDMDRATLSGPKFIFAFHPTEAGSSPDATPICGMDFAAFSQALESGGFHRETRYGEHGRSTDTISSETGCWCLLLREEKRASLQKKSHMTASG
jgi:hypothetical protein